MTKVYDNATDLITFARLQSQNTTSGSSYLGSDGLLKFAAEDEPRIEYGSDGSLKGLLIEEQRENLVTYSEDFEGSGWSFGSADVQADQETAPDGTQSASQLALLTLGNLIYAVASVTAGAEYTFSWYIKAGTATSHIYAFYDETNAQFVDRADYTITDGEKVGNGWFRMSQTVTAPAGCTTLRAYPLRTSNNSGEVSATLGTSFLWGAQLEEGSFPTSYIPTSGSQQTRSADVASIPVSAFGYNQDAGTVVVEFDVVGFSPNGPTGYPRVWEVNQASGKYIAAMSSDEGDITFREDESSTSLNTGSLTENTMAVMASAFADDDLATSLNGATALTATPSYTLDLPTTLGIGSTVAGLRSLNGHIKSLKYYPRRLTDAQLQELTA